MLRIGLIGTGGFAQNAFEPSKPRSSAVKQTKSMLREGGGILAMASANSSTAVVPVASSSAPL